MFHGTVTHGATDDTVCVSEMHGPLSNAGDSVGTGNSEPSATADDFLSQVRADVAQDTDSVEPDFETRGRPEGESCKLQYIEIVPLDSPKEAENNSACDDEVKEEIKKETDEEVCNM